MVVYGGIGQYSHTERIYAHVHEWTYWYENIIAYGIAVATSYDNIAVYTNGHICAMTFTNMERLIISFLV